MSETRTKKGVFRYQRNERMKLIRFKCNDMSQEKAAALCGFNAQYFSRVERGMNDGSIEFWRNFKKAFNLSDSEIWAVIENYPLETEIAPSRTKAKKTKGGKNA